MGSRKCTFISQEHLVNSLYQEARLLASTDSVMARGFAAHTKERKANRVMTNRKCLPSFLNLRSRRDAEEGVDHARFRDHQKGQALSSVGHCTRVHCLALDSFPFVKALGRIHHQPMTRQVDPRLPSFWQARFSYSFSRSGAIPEHRGALSMSDQSTSQPRKKLYIETVGCQMNVLDSELVVARLRKQGYELTDDIDQADTILYNTCSVRQHAEDKTLQRSGANQAYQEAQAGSVDRRARMHGTERSGTDPQTGSACGRGGRAGPARAGASASFSSPGSRRAAACRQS